MISKIIAAVILISLTSCSDRPPRERFPGPQGETTDIRGAQNNQAVMGGFNAREAGAEVQSSESLRGVIRLSKSLKLPSKEYAMFISARSLKGGPPLAAKKIFPKKFPLRFRLGPENTMMKGRPIVGEVELSVRIIQKDESGRIHPLGRSPGDLYGQKKVSVGDQAVEIVIDKDIL